MNDSFIHITEGIKEAACYAHYWDCAMKVMYADLTCPYCSADYKEVHEATRFLDCNCGKVFRVQV